MKKKIVSILLIVLCFGTYAQKEKKTRLPILLKELDFQIFDPVILKNTSGKLTDTSTITYFLYDYKGSLKFQIFNAKHDLVQTGNYSKSLAIFKRYHYKFNVLKGTFEISIQEYYEPLKTGHWSYYDKKTIVKDVVFDRGIEVDH